MRTITVPIPAVQKACEVLRDLLKTGKTDVPQEAIRETLGAFEDAFIFSYPSSAGAESVAQPAQDSLLTGYIYENGKTIQTSFDPFSVTEYGKSVNEVLKKDGTFRKFSFQLYAVVGGVRIVIEDDTFERLKNIHQIHPERIFHAATRFTPDGPKACSATAYKYTIAVKEDVEW
ncbi:MAG: hypothetical protein AB7D36_11135 [Oscillospiraceae bacterium]